MTYEQKASDLAKALLIKAGGSPAEAMKCPNVLRCYMPIKRIFVLVFLSLFGIGCVKVCDNEIIQEEYSPDKRYKAVAFVRSCGATTSFSPQVSIIGRSIVLRNEPGNVFICNHSQNIEVRWKDNNTLLIRHDCVKEDIFKEEHELYGVHIIYERLLL